MANYLFIVVILFSSGVTLTKERQQVISLTETSWVRMLEGEWLVKFYATWCPACQAMEGAWQKVASWGEDLDINVADVNIVDNPGLSGRFLVTSLPTIYHVKDGVFRQYIGSRDEKEIVAFVDDKKWMSVEPVSWYKDPTSFHMAAIGWCFKTSMLIRDLHNSMTEEYGIPVWASYLLFALATIFVGLVLGFVIVCLCDKLFPPKPYAGPYKRVIHNQAKHNNDTQEAEESDVIEDDRPVSQSSPKEVPRDEMRKRNIPSPGEQ